MLSASVLNIQLALSVALCGLVCLSLLRPSIGLAVSSLLLVGVGAEIYADIGPTSPHLTTAAICIAGGLICAGLAGLIRCREAMTVTLLSRPTQKRDYPSTWDFLDEVLDEPISRSPGRLSVQRPDASE
jgi:hypothetical protein